jgi:hypothetical protein
MDPGLGRGLAGAGLVDDRLVVAAQDHRAVGHGRDALRIDLGVIDGDIAGREGGNGNQAGQRQAGRKSVKACA